MTERVLVLIRYIGRHRAEYKGEPKMNTSFFPKISPERSTRFVVIVIIIIIIISFTRYNM